jgi:hypothetical protein
MAKKKSASFKFAIGQPVVTSYGGPGVVRSRLTAYGENIYRIHGKTDSSDYPENQVRKMTKKKGITVHITKTRQKQAYSVVIDKPGKAEPFKLKQQYKTRYTAKRAALRNLDGRSVNGTYPIKAVGEGRTNGDMWSTPEGVAITFVHLDKTTKRK